MSEKNDVQFDDHGVSWRVRAAYGLGIWACPTKVELMSATNVSVLTVV
jgi:hypothetical protein